MLGLRSVRRERDVRNRLERRFEEVLRARVRLSPMVRRVSANVVFGVEAVLIGILESDFMFEEVDRVGRERRRRTGGVASSCTVTCAA